MKAFLVLLSVVALLSAVTSGLPVDQQTAAAAEARVDQEAQASGRHQRSAWGYGDHHVEEIKEVVHHHHTKTVPVPYAVEKKVPVVIEKKVPVYIKQKPGPISIKIKKVKHHG